MPLRRRRLCRRSAGGGSAAGQRASLRLRAVLRPQCGRPFFSSPLQWRTPFCVHRAGGLYSRRVPGTFGCHSASGLSCCGRGTGEAQRQPRNGPPSPLRRACSPVVLRPSSVSTTHTHRFKGPLVRYGSAPCKAATHPCPPPPPPYLRTPWGTAASQPNGRVRQS